jgi:hypothetical protein
VRAGDEVVAARGQRGQQDVADDAQVRELGFNLGELGRGASLQSGFRPDGLLVRAEVEQVGDLVEGEPKSSNSAIRSGRSVVGSVHACGAHDSVSALMARR